MVVGPTVPNKFVYIMVCGVVMEWSSNFIGRIVLTNMVFIPGGIGWGRDEE